MSNQVKKLINRHEYLVRMILTISTVLLIPILATTYILNRQSYMGINTQNTDYYVTYTYNFSNFYKEQTNRLLDVAQRVCFDGKLKQDDKNNVKERPFASCFHIIQKIPYHKRHKENHQCVFIQKAAKKYNISVDGA